MGGPRGGSQPLRSRARGSFPRFLSHSADDLLWRLREDFTGLPDSGQSRGPLRVVGGRSTAPLRACSRLGLLAKRMNALKGSVMRGTDC